MARLSLTLLGGFQARLGGEVLTTFESNKVRGLLAYLAAEADRPQRREALAALLWPDWPQSSAMRNLSYALADLRKNLGDREAKPPFLLISRDTLQLNQASDIQADLWDFNSQLSAFSNQQSQISNLQSTIDLYQGPFLEGFSLPDSASFEEWLAASREGYQRQALQTLHSLAETYQTQGEYALGLVYAHRQLELEPWQEEAHQQVMRLLALSGQRTAALAEYERCCKTLKAELGVEPGEETRRLVEAIRTESIEGIKGKGTTALPAVPAATEPLPPEPGAPPFKGLQYFDEADAGIFFGRAALTEKLVSHITEMVANGPGDAAEKPGGVLAIVGASGSGKSSVVRAGLVPALKGVVSAAGNPRLPPGSSSWLFHILTPTSHPLESLAMSLTRGAESPEATALLMDSMTAEPRSLRICAGKLLSMTSQSEGQPIAKWLVLVIDQFEELFTLCRSESERAAFMDNLLNAAGRGVLVAIVLRADFYAHCARYPYLRETLAGRQEYLGPMSAAELRQAIEGPARLGSWELAPGLVNLILRDVGASDEHPPEPGALPLLEHALLETWLRRSGRTLTLQGYAAAGGVQGAIAHTAESVFQRLTGEQQVLARRIFLRLTELGEGTQDTRRRVALSEIVSGSGAAPEVESLLKELADARLITLAEGTVEVAHEALIREWPALRAWLSEDRESLRLHRRLTESAQGWDLLSKDSGELYRGARLAQVLEWAAQPGRMGELNALEQEFLSASQAQAESEAREREAQRLRELEVAQKLAEAERKNANEQRRSARRLRQRAWYLAGAAALALILMIAAVLIAVAANRSARQATARQYASAALANLTIDPGQSISQALQSLQVDPSLEAYSALHQALFATHLRSRLDAGQGKVYGIAVSPDGARLATIGTDRTLKVWRLNGETIEQPPLLTISDVGMDEDQLKSYPYFENILQFSPDGRYLATVNNSAEILLLDSISGEVAEREDHSGETGSQAVPLSILTLAFGPDRSSQNGVRLAFSTFSTIWIEELSRGSSNWIAGLESAYGNMEYGLALAFRPDGKIVTGGTVDGSSGVVKILTLPTQSTLWKNTLLVERVGDPIFYISLSPDGNQVAYTTSTEAHILDLTPLASGEPPVERLTIPLESELSSFNTTIFFLPGSKRLATADRRGLITIWDATTGLPLFTPIRPESGLSAVAVSPVSQILFTAHDNGEICSWDVAAPGSPEWVAFPTGGARAGVVLNPNGVDLLSWNITNAGFGAWDFAHWRIDNGQTLNLGEFTTNTDPSAFNYGFHFGPTRVAVGTFNENGVVRVQNALTGELINILEPGAGTSRFTLNSDGSRVYFARIFGTVDVWDADAGSKLNSFQVTSDLTPNHDVYLDLSGDDSLLLTWERSDPDVRLWDAVSGQLIRKFYSAKIASNDPRREQHYNQFVQFNLASNAVCDPTLTSDNRFLVTCGPDQTALVWEVASGKLARNIHLPAEPGWLQISPDNRYLVASLGASQTAVFDFASGRELAILPGTITLVNDVEMGYQFSPDNRYILITFPGDEAAYGFVLDNNELARLACQRLAAITLPEADGVVLQLPICQAALN